MGESRRENHRDGPRHLVQSIHTAPEIPGRREFFTYRELGLKAATGGRVGGKTMSIRKEISEPTGWHFHSCDYQINYVLKGWFDIAFEDGTELRVKAGDVIMIPGNYLHNELATSDDVESIEFCMPAEMGTIAAEAPSWWAEREKIAISQA